MLMAPSLELLLTSSSLKVSAWLSKPSNNTVHKNSCKIQLISSKAMLIFNVNNLLHTTSVQPWIEPYKGTLFSPRREAGWRPPGEDPVLPDLFCRPRASLPHLQAPLLPRLGARAMDHHLTPRVRHTFHLFRDQSCIQYTPILIFCFC